MNNLSKQKEYLLRDEAAQVFVYIELGLLVMHAEFHGKRSDGFGAWGLLVNGTENQYFSGYPSKRRQVDTPECVGYGMVHQRVLITQPYEESRHYQQKNTGAGAALRNHSDIKLPEKKGHPLLREAVEQYEHNNCFAKCIAWMLNVPKHHIPNFIGEIDEEKEWDEWWPPYLKWLRARGWNITCMQLNEDVPYVEGDVIGFGDHSESGVYHAVVLRDGKVIYDPALKPGVDLDGKVVILRPLFVRGMAEHVNLKNGRVV